LKLIESCIPQLKAQGPSRTCNEGKEAEVTLAHSLFPGAAQQVELASLPPSQLTVEVPMTWKVGQKLAVKIPGGRTIAVAAPPGQTPGSSFAIGLGAPQQVGTFFLLLSNLELSDAQVYEP